MTFRQVAYKNITRNLRAYLAFYLGSSFAVMIFFVFAMFMYHPALESGYLNKVAEKGMVAAEWIIFGFSILFVLYSMSAFLRARKEEFGILTIQGASPKQIRWLVTIESLMISAGSVLTGILAGFIFSKFFFVIGANVLDMDALALYVPWKALGLTIVVFFLLFLVISQFTLFMIRTEKTVALLKGVQVPKKEPKFSTFFSIAGLLFLVLGYGLSMRSGTDMTSAVIILICTIIGTYLFYSQLSIGLLKGLKKNKHFYRKGTNMIWISDLAYRIKDNARLFFIVSIVSAVAFTAIGVLVVYQSSTSFPETAYAMEYLPFSDEAEKDVQKDVQFVNSQLAEHGVSYRLDQIDAVRVRFKKNNGTVPPMLVIPQKTLSKVIPEWQQTSLKNRTGIYFQGVYEDKETLPSTFHFIDGSMTMDIQSIRKPLLLSESVLVVNADTFAQLESSHQEVTFYGYQLNQWKNTLGISQSIKDFVSGDRTDVSGDFSSKAMRYYAMVQMPNLSLFIGLFIGIVFFFAAASFLYFRIFSDLQEDQDKYKALAKIGFSEKEMARSVTIELAILFFLPFLLAIVDTGFALHAYDKGTGNVLKSTILTIVGCIILQVLYFIVIRMNYVKNLKRSIYR
ncbi:ABC transporter permease [Salibacterium sp. K-3]